MTTHIIAACRSAVAPLGGALAALDIDALAAPVVTAALVQAGLAPAQIDEIIVSNALGAGGNPARLVALAAGLPEAVAGLSIDRQCAGGMDAVLLARQMILAGTADVVLCGGVESTSRRPLRSRTFADGRAPEPYDQARFTPWATRDPQMHAAAADLAVAQGISRQDQDDWAVHSHAKALTHDPSASELAACRDPPHRSSAGRHWGIFPINPACPPYLPSHAHLRKHSCARRIWTLSS